MGKNDNSIALRFLESLKAHAGEEAAERFAREHSLSKTDSASKKAAWAESVCDYLEDGFGEAAIRAIREDCACTPPVKSVEAGRRLFLASASLAEFAEKFKAESKEAFDMWEDGGALMFSYPRCYCSCVKNGGKQLPATWCMCTVGYAKRMFGGIIGRPCHVELLESVITGGSRCLMRVTF